MQKLLDAVNNSYISPETIKFYIRKGADVNTFDDDGNTVLMTALRFIYNTQVIAILLNAGANVNAQNKAGMTPIMTAAMYNTNPRILSLMISKGADIHIHDKYGNNILMLAAKYNDNPFVIRELINAGIDVNAVNNYSRTALMFAAMNEHDNPEIARVLICTGADTEELDKLGHGAEYYAYEAKQDEYTGEYIFYRKRIREFFIWRGHALLDVDWSSITYEEVMNLIYSGADVNASRYSSYYECYITPLTEAAEKTKDSRIIEALINAGAYNIDNALDSAVYADNYDAIQTLLMFGANPNSTLSCDAADYLTIFMKAARDHLKPDIIKLLARNVNFQGDIDYALVLAVKNNEYAYDIRVIETLISLGANANAMKFGNQQITVLMIACSVCLDCDTISMLLKAGAKVNARDTSGRTALMWLLSDEYADAYIGEYDDITYNKYSDSFDNNNISDTLKAIDILCEFGADINAKDKYGWTALFYAVQSDGLYNVPEIIDTLIFAGIDVSAKDSSGRTALDHTREELKNDYYESSIEKLTEIINILEGVM